MIELSFPGDLTDVDELATHLFTTGLSRSACDSRARLFARAAAALSVTGRAGSGQPPLAFFVPGRIQVLGKHTADAGGRTLLAAVERGVCIAASPRDDRQIVVIDAATGETVIFRADPGLRPQTGSWSFYPMTVARRVARNFPGAVRGADIALMSDLPRAAGLGSSSALVAGVFLALSEINQLPARDDYWHNIGSRTDLAGYLAAVETGQAFGALDGEDDAGTFASIEDMTAILCSEPNHVSQYSFGPVEFEKMIELPPAYLFAVCASGVVAENANAVRASGDVPARLAAALATIWRRETGRDDPHLAAALGSSPDAAERIEAILNTADDGYVAEYGRDALLNRLKHFMLEGGELLPAASDALERGDLRSFARLVERSQHAAERLLGIQTPETTFLAAKARELGAAAASAFTSGHGGSVWAMVKATDVDDFLAAWAARYQEHFPQHAKTSRFFITAAGPAAFRVC
jgi:galactokinase